jgi:DNA-binding FrmR family transcriptional regulator
VPGYPEPHPCAAEKRRLLARCRRIEAQARGLAKLVEEDRYCLDIMRRIASLRAAADGVALTLLRDHMDACVREAVESDGRSGEIDDVMEVVRRYTRT